MYHKKEWGRWGYVNQKDEWVIPPQYLYCSNFYDGVARAELGKRRECLIDIKAKVIAEYRKLESYVSDGLFLFRTDNELMAGYVKDCEIKEEKLIAPLPSKSKMFNKILLSNAAYYIKNPLRQVIYYDHVGQTIRVIQLPGRPWLRLNEHHFMIRNVKESTMRCYDIGQETFVGPVANYFGYSDGLYCIYNLNRKYQFLDQDWKDVFGFEFDEARPFSNGLTPIKNGDKYTIIDRHNNPQFSFRCDELLQFDSQTKWSIVVRDEDRFIIDQNYDIILGPAYSITLWEDCDYPYYEVCLNRNEIDLDIIYDRNGNFITKYSSDS